MSRYIDADAFKDRLENLAYEDWNQGASTTWATAYGEVAEKVDDEPTADVLEILTNELTNEISDRIIQFLEENYEIIPKKSVVRCKDCKFRGHIQLCPFGKRAMPHENGYCCYGERRADDVENEKVDITKMRVEIEEILRILHK